MNFFTTDLFVRLGAAAIASLSFAVLFHIDRRHLPLSTIGSTVTYFIFYTVMFFNGSDFAAALLSTLFTALFSKFAARARRAPTIVFLIPAIIPTVPGASLYNTMHHAISGEWNIAFDHLLVALEIAFGIAGGILIVSAVYDLVMDFYKKQKKETTENPSDHSNVPIDSTKS